MNEFRIYVDHDAYYTRVPIPDAEAVETDLDSTFDGYKLRQIVIDKPTDTTIDVNWDQIRKIQDDQVAVGSPPMSHQANLLQHLKDGPLFKHMPAGSITAIRCPDQPKVEKWLNDYFLADPLADDLDEPVPSEGDNEL